MISKDKTYRTRDGREVRIYAIDGRGDYPVHGAIQTITGWEAHIWFKSGKSIFEDETERSGDLIEVKPRIKRTVWLNVYPDKNGDYSQLKGLADALAATDRLACVKVEIDCEEGEGL
jgi:hypothetical protein